MKIFQSEKSQDNGYGCIIILKIFKKEIALFMALCSLFVNMNNLFLSLKIDKQIMYSFIRTKHYSDFAQRSKEFSQKIS